MEQFCLLKLSSDERKLSSLKDIYHKRQRENKQMADQSFMPPSQPSHPPEVTFISLLHLSLEDGLGWFHMACPLLPPPVSCWNSTWRDGAAWERIQLERTSEQSSTFAAQPWGCCRDRSAAAAELHVELQWQGFPSASHRTGSFHPRNRTGTGCGNDFFIVSISLYSSQPCR